MSEKMPVVIDNTRYESLSEAADVLGIGFSTIRTASDRAINSGGTTMVKGKVLKIIGAPVGEIKITKDVELDVITIESGRQRIDVRIDRAKYLIDKLSDMYGKYE